MPPTPPLPRTRVVRWPSLRTVALTLIAIAGLAGLVAVVALVTFVCSGCAPSSVVVAPVRTASNDAADAIAVVERLEIARIKALRIAGMNACPIDDVPCLEAVKYDVKAAEAPRIAAIEASVKAQHEVAQAVIDFDSCGLNGGAGQQACEANGIALLTSLAPAVAQLIVDVRKESAP